MPGLDPDIGRRVTIELHPVDPERSAVQQLDAQAVARLRHPHVLAVHDAGTCDEGAYVVTEYVSPLTLAQWLEAPRREGDAVDLFGSLGEALCAAHEAGLACGPFSAGCVVWTSDGSARLTGLRVVAPDQREAAARADRGAFCGAVLESVHKGTLPRGLHHLLEQGRRLEEDDSEVASTPAPPSLPAIVAALQPRRRRRVASLLFAAVAVLATLVVIAVRDRVVLCGGGQERIDQLLTAGRSVEDVAVAPLLASFRESWVKQYRAACLATRLQGLQSEHDMALRLSCLDERAADLRGALSMWSGATSATDRARATELVRGVTVIECGDPLALRAEAPLPEDPALRQRVTEIRAELAISKALHDAGHYREGLAQIERTLAAARETGYPPLMAVVLYRQGQLLKMSGAHAAAERVLFEAVFAAEESHLDSLAAQGLLTLIYLVGVQLGQPVRAEDIAQQAAAALRRSGTPYMWGQWHRQMGTLRLFRGDYSGALAHYQSIPEEDMRLAAGHLDLDNNIGVALAGLGRLDEARLRFHRSLKQREEQLGPSHPGLMATLDNLADVLGRQGLLEERLRLVEREWQIGQSSQRTGHPAGGVALVGLGRARWAIGRATEGEADLRRGVALLEKTLGPQHLEVARSLSQLGVLLLEDGRDREAEEVLARADAIFEAQGYLDRGATQSALRQARSGGK